MPPSNESRNETPGILVDRYRLVCPLAQGGMGSVWLARMDGAFGLEKLVALKTILPNYANDERFRSMFLDEARLTARISHPNVAAVLEIGESEGSLYYVMEWVDGEPLRIVQRVCAAAGETVPPAIAARIIADTCLGLHAAHELRDQDGTPLEVVHRDVSPQNILMTEDGIPRLIDFGIAKARARVSEATEEGTMKGKLEYIAPEQAAGGAVDRRTDVWGAGAVLFHLVAGRPVFERDNHVAVATALLASREPDPLPDTVPAPLAAAIRRAIAPDPNARYATALEMARALDTAMRESAQYTTQADVAGFLAARLADKRQARRATITAALASVRSFAAEPILDAPPAMTSSADGKRELAWDGTPSSLASHGDSALASPEAMSTARLNARRAIAAMIALIALTWLVVAVVRSTHAPSDGASTAPSPQPAESAPRADVLAMPIPAPSSEPPTPRATPTASAVEAPTVATAASTTRPPKAPRRADGSRTPAPSATAAPTINPFDLR